MRDQKDDLRDCPTAYECRDRLPELAGWMSDDDLKLLMVTDSVEEACETIVKCYNDKCWEIEDSSEAAKVQSELSDKIHNELRPSTDGHEPDGSLDDKLAKSPASPAKHDAE